VVPLRELCRCQPFSNQVHRGRGFVVCVLYWYCAPAHRFSALGFDAGNLSPQGHIAETAQYMGGVEQSFSNLFNLVLCMDGEC